MIPPDKRSWYYLGCINGPGHYLTDKNGRSAYINELSRLDGQLCLPDNTLYQAVLNRIPHLNYSALAWWDKTVDKRPGSNSIIFAPSSTCTLDGIRSGMTRWFPWVEARLPQPLVIHSEERVYDG